MRPASFRDAVRIVALLNAGYFGIEFAVATALGSVSLFADSIDFLEDASFNLLILLALAWSAKARARLGIVLAGILLVPELVTLWTVFKKIVVFSPPPEPFAMSVTGFGALIINLVCAFLLARFRHHSGSLSRAAFLSARNDAIANIAIIAAAGITAVYASPWPDLIVGLGIGILNADAARKVFSAARAEHAAAPP